MAVCQTCGNENRAEARYCRYCGATLETQAVEEPSSEAVETPPYSLPEIPYAGETEIFGELEETDEFLPAPEAAVEGGSALLVVETGDSEEPEENPVSGDQESLSETLAPVVLEESGEETPQVAEVHFQAQFDEDDSIEGFGALPAGVLLNGRYRVLSLLADEPEAKRYQVEDMLRCWSCGAEQAGVEQQYCEVCGAELIQKKHRILRAYLTDQAPQDMDECFSEAGVFYCLEALPPPEPANQPPPLVRLAAGFRTHPGLEREINEDSLLALQLAAICELPCLPTAGFFAVADGIGGNEAGEIASHMAVHCLAAEVMEKILSPAAGQAGLPATDQEALVKGAALTANQAILTIRSQATTETNMGCTLTAALVWGLQAFVVNVGDSRTYLLREGRLTQITRDHSVVARLVEQGYISKDETYAHNQKSVIYRSLGDRPDLDVDTFRLDLVAGDRLLLCSDGLWEMVRDPLIEEVLLERFDPQQACDRLVDMANLSGGEDNISVVVVNIDTSG